MPDSAHERVLACVGGDRHSSVAEKIGRLTWTIAHESWSEWTDRSARGRWSSLAEAARDAELEMVSVVPTLEHWPVGFGMAAYSAAMPTLVASALLGSVGMHCVLHAPCPITIVRPAPHPAEEQSPPDTSSP